MAMKKKAGKLGQRSATPEDVKLGEKIRARRIAANMSQDELGKALGVSFQQVQKYEKGTNRVSAMRLQKIASVLNENVSFFHHGDGSNGPVSVEGLEMLAMVADKGNQRMCRALTKLDVPTRWKLVQMVEHIAVLVGE